MSMEGKTAPAGSWKKVEIRRYNFLLLPDELVISVLSRLPAKDVIRYQQVCKRWRYLISTQYFLDLHIRNHPTAIDHHPVILVNACKNEWTSENFLLKNEWWDHESPAPSAGTTILGSLNTYPGYRPYRYFTHQCSGNGFVVLKMKSEYSFTVFNPIHYQDDNNKVTIIFPSKSFSKTEALAIYFHPTLKHYCILFLWAEEFPRGNLLLVRKGYAILVLGPKPCWRNISDPWNIHNDENPYKSIGILVEDKYLYWLVKRVENNNTIEKFDIMEFDIISEELTVMSSPPVCLNNQNISLLKVDGILSLFLISTTEKLVYQWTLTDRVLRQWTAGSIYSIIDMCQFDKPVRAIALIRDTGDLLIESDKICVFNIKSGSMRKLETNGYSINTLMPHHVVITSCASSPSSSKSNIFLASSLNKKTLLEPMEFREYWRRQVQYFDQHLFVLN